MTYDLIAQSATDSSIWLPLALVVLGGGLATTVVTLVVGWWRKGIDEQDSTFTQLERFNDRTQTRCAALEERNETLENQYRDCRNRKGRLERLAVAHGVPLALIQEALK